MADTTPQFNTCKCWSSWSEDQRDDGLVVRVHYGCGDIIPKRRRFKPGHDAKLKSRLLWAFRAEVPFVYIDDGQETARDPLAMAKELGWGHFMTAAKPKKPKKAKKAAEPNSDELAGFRPARVKDGRWWKDGHIVAETDDEVTVRIHGKGGTPKDITVPRGSDKLEVG